MNVSLIIRTIDIVAVYDPSKVETPVRIRHGAPNFMINPYEVLTEECKFYVGKTIEDVNVFLKESSKVGRVLSENDTQFAGTCDYRLDRVNLSVENGIVTSAWPG